MSIKKNLKDYCFEAAKLELRAQNKTFTKGAREEILNTEIGWVFRKLELEYPDYERSSLVKKFYKSYFNKEVQELDFDSDALIASIYIEIEKIDLEEFYDGKGRTAEEIFAEIYPRLLQSGDVYFSLKQPQFEYATHAQTENDIIERVTETVLTAQIIEEDAEDGDVDWE